MADDDDGLMWPPNLLKNIQDVSEQATRQQQEALQQLLLGGGGTPDLGDISGQMGAMTQMATFKTRIQSGGRISVPDEPDPEGVFDGAEAVEPEDREAGGRERPE